MWALGCGSRSRSRVDVGSSVSVVVPFPVWHGSFGRLAEDLLRKKNCAACSAFAFITAVDRLAREEGRPKRVSRGGKKTRRILNRHVVYHRFETPPLKSPPPGFPPGPSFFAASLLTLRRPCRAKPPSSLRLHTSRQAVGLRRSVPPRSDNKLARTMLQQYSQKDRFDFA